MCHYWMVKPRPGVEGGKEFLLPAPHSPVSSQPYPTRLLSH